MFIKLIKKLYRKPHVNPFFRLTATFKPLKFNGDFLFYSIPFFPIFAKEKNNNNDNSNKVSELHTCL